VFLATDLASAQQFKETCLSRGNFLFEGNNSDLNEINKLLFTKEAPIIHQPKQIGYYEGNWIFANCGIDKEGNVIPMDDNGVIWINNKGYQVPNIYIGEEDDNSTLPTFDLHESITDAELQQIAHTFKNNLNSFEAYLALGWVVAGIHSNPIFKAKHKFPFLFISGKRRSGKSTVGSWLMQFFGMDVDDGKGISGSSVVSISRKLGYFSSLPSWYDEYKSTDKKVKQKDSLLRGVYNRQGTDKGIKANFGLRTEKIRGYVLLTGEEVPEDNALLTRCVVIQLSENKRSNKYYKDMLKLTHKFPVAGLYWIQQAQKKGSDELLEIIEELYKELVNEEIDGRTADNYAIIAGSFIFAYKSILNMDELDEFKKWLITEAKRNKQEQESEHILNIFFDDLSTLTMDGEIELDKDMCLDGTTLYISFNRVYDIWAEYCKRVNKATIPKQSLLNYIKEEPFFIDGSVKRWMPLRKASVRTISIDITKCNELAPLREWIKNLENNTEEEPY